jgi:hypothetical protein
VQLYGGVVSSWCCQESKGVAAAGELRSWAISERHLPLWEMEPILEVGVSAPIAGVVGIWAKDSLKIKMYPYKVECIAVP